jgi:uncharacterized iron-regulated membrane protein
VTVDWRDKLLRRLHLCIGGILGIPLIIIGLTGSILVFNDELQSWLDPLPRAQTDGTPHALVDIIAAAGKSAPEGYRASLIFPPSEAGVPAEVRFSDPKRPGPGGVQIFVDPASLNVLAVKRPGESLLRQFFLLHANFLTQDRSGRGVVGWFGVAMCVLGASGLILWWPRRNWRAAFTVDRNARGPVLLRQIHGAVGIWSLIVFMIVSFSGVWLAFPQTFNGLASSWLGARDLRPGPAGAVVKPVAGATALDADGVAALAVVAAPDASLRFIGLPLRPEQAYRVALTRSPGDSPVFGITLLVDPWVQRIIERRDPRGYSFAEKLVVAMHGIHEGSGFGWVWRVLVFLSGLLPALFAVSGVWMWLLKRRKRQMPLASDVVAVPGE